MLMSFSTDIKVLDKTPKCVQLWTSLFSFYVHSEARPSALQCFFLSLIPLCGFCKWGNKLFTEGKLQNKLFKNIKSFMDGMPAIALACIKWK